MTTINEIIKEGCKTVPTDIGNPYDNPDKRYYMKRVEDILKILNRPNKNKPYKGPIAEPAI